MHVFVRLSSYLSSVFYTSAAHSLLQVETYFYNTKSMLRYWFGIEKSGNRCVRVLDGPWLRRMSHG
jgi:hypothetical protein